MSENTELALEMRKFYTCPITRGGSIKMPQESFTKICLKQQIRRSQGGGVNHGKYGDYTSCSSCDRGCRILAGKSFVPPESTTFVPLDVLIQERAATL